MTHCPGYDPTAYLSRRGFLYGLGASLGSVAFTSMLASEAGAALQLAGARRPGGGDPHADDPLADDPLAVRPPHFESKAKSCVFLMMAGGPSHIDTFDPKPELDGLHMKKFVRKDRFASGMASGRRYYVKSPFAFRRAGDAGIDMCEHFAHLAGVADELCVYRGCVGESINHPTAMYHMNTGNRFGGDPAMGAWMTYGLGSLNRDLPAFVVLPGRASPQGGAASWSNGFLPAHFQGTPLRPKGSPILDLQPPDWVSRSQQRRNLDLLGELNRLHEKSHPGHDELAARIDNYELAFRMQMEVPDIIDLSKEDEKTLDLYGIGDPVTDDVARQCLLARRLVERGVRFVQIYVGGWDSHDYIERAHANRIRAVDRPIAALITDLKRRGMLDETLLVWTGEFGRSPDNGMRAGGVKYGRDHNAEAMAMWFAGGGVKAGHVVGATDEIGQRAVEVVNPIKNIHVTLLHLLGLDDNKLTYFHGGRFKQLSQTGGELVKELLA